MSIALEVIVSQFDNIIGPIAVGFYPKDVCKYTQDTVSNMTIDLLTYTEETFDELAIMSFPQIKKKGLVKLLEWEDPTNQRGGRREVTLSILFEEKDDSILYKYKDDIEEQINQFLIDFLPFIQKNEVIDNLQEKLKTIHKEIQDLLLKLSFQEFNMAENSKQFPQTTKKEDFGFKTIVIGDPGVGKTSMILQFTEKAFRRSYIPTIGTNITEKSIFLHDAEFHMILWDLAGQSKFHKLRSLYYIGAQCVIIVFDLTKSKSYMNIRNWYSDLQNNFSNFEDLEIILCGNKSDLKDKIQISEEEALCLASELNIDYLETSARNGKNINTTFFNMVNNMISKDFFK